MIALIRGTLLEKEPPLLVIDVNGLGYEVQVAMTTMYELPALGEEVSLHIHMVIRDDAHSLFGFYCRQDRELFRILVKVNGVGPKLALAIMSNLAHDELAFLVNEKDVSSLVKIPGVGKKTAERLLVELGDKLADWEGTSPEGEIVKSHSQPGDTLVTESISALEGLGYKASEAGALVSAVLREQEVETSEELIRLALRNAIRV
jgi:Holliday junction DNA helicase RuvA